MTPLRDSTLNKLFLILSLSIFVSNTLVSTQQHPDALYYLVLIEASSTSPNFTDSFYLTAYLKTSIATSTLKYEKLVDIEVNSPSKYVRDYRDLADKFLSRFFSKVRAYSKTAGGEKTYWSLDSHIVEAETIRLSNGVEYREVNTGLYLGGRYRETHSVTFYGLFRTVTLNYEFNVAVILKNIEPQMYVNQLSVVSIPVDLVKNVLLFFAAVTTVISIYVLTNWKKYRLV